MLNFRHPDYSYDMIQSESEGSVKFEFDLDKAGTPSDLRITSSTPPFLFDRKTIESFAKAKFAPASNGADALACKGQVQSFLWKMPE
jgi:TonB family protein